MTLEELSNYDPDVINGSVPIDYDVETDDEELFVVKQLLYIKF